MRPFYLLLCTIWIWSCASSPRELEEDHTKDPVVKNQMDPGQRRVRDFVGIGPLGGRSNPIKCRDMDAIEEYVSRLIPLNSTTLSHSAPQEMGVGPFESLIYVVAITYEIDGVEQVEHLFFDPGFINYHENSVPRGFKIK